MLVRTPTLDPGSRPGWPEEAGRASEWVDWWGAVLVQRMQNCAVAYPRGLRRPQAAGAVHNDVVVAVPSTERPHPFMHQVYAAYMELRVPTSIPAHSRERVAKLLTAEGVELRSHVNGMRTADPSTRKAYPSPRPVSVWLLMQRRVGAAHTDACPSEVEYLNGFAHLFASHAPGAAPLQRHVRGAVACGNDALEVARAHNAGGFEGAALLVVTHVQGEATGAGVGSEPFCVLYQLSATRVTLSVAAQRGDPPAATWQDADDRPPRRFANVAELFQAVLTEVAKFRGVAMPPALFNPLAPMAPDAFRQHVAEAAREFSALLHAEPVVRHPPFMPEETPLCATGVMLRITPWRSLHDATERQFADTAQNAHLDAHERRHITSLSRFERDAFPAMLLCAKGFESVARNYASEFWSLRPLRGAGEEAAWMHVAQMRVRPLAVHGDISAYGACGVAGEPVGEGVLGQRHLALLPVAEIDIAKQFCVQPCGRGTFVPRGGDRDVMRAYTVAMKALANFVDHDCIAAYPSLVGELSPHTGASAVSSMLADFGIDEHGTQRGVWPTGAPGPSPRGRGAYKRPLNDVYSATTGRMLLPFDLLSTRTTVGEACAFVGVKGEHVADGVRDLVFAMLNHSGASTSLCAALAAHARLSEAYMESGADADEIHRLRRVDLASRKMTGLAAAV